MVIEFKVDLDPIFLCPRGQGKRMPLRGMTSKIGDLHD